MTADPYSASSRPSPPSGPTDLGAIALIWSDYQMYCDLTPETRRTSMLKAPVRFLINTTLRAQVLFRLTCAAPRWGHWFFRSALTVLHSSEIVYGAQIGPRLHLPHPYGISIGGQVHIGQGVTLGQHVTLGSDLGATGQPEVGDHALILAGAVVVGPVRVGRGAVVGANCVLEQDVADGGLAAPARTRIVNRRINHRMSPVEGHGDRDPS